MRTDTESRELARAQKAHAARAHAAGARAAGAVAKLLARVQRLYGAHTETSAGVETGKDGTRRRETTLLRCGAAVVRHDHTHDTARWPGEHEEIVTVRAATRSVELARIRLWAQAEDDDVWALGVHVTEDPGPEEGWAVAAPGSVDALLDSDALARALVGRALAQAEADVAARGERRRAGRAALARGESVVLWAPHGEPWAEAKETLDAWQCAAGAGAHTRIEVRTLDKGKRPRSRPGKLAVVALDTPLVEPAGIVAMVLSAAGAG